MSLSNLALNSYSPQYDRMTEESGDKNSPIWLLINRKYPYVRQEIWTPILYEIQDNVFRKLHTQIETKNIFIKQTISDIGLVPSAINRWDVAKEIESLRDSVLEYQPKILITFGLTTYEFVKRVFEIRSEKGPKYWNTTNLEEEFEMAIKNFDINGTNRIPLPRRVMNSGNFIEDPEDWEYGENYLREVGQKLAARIIENKDSLNIWIE